MKYVTYIKIREKGQITLPSKLRSTLQLKKGSELIALATGREIVLTPKIENPLEKFGMLGKEKGVKRVKDLLLRYEAWK